MEEHTAMIECRCPESDRLAVLCVSCGRCFLPDPSYVVLALCVLMFGAHIAYWIAL